MKRSRDRLLAAAAVVLLGVACVTGCQSTALTSAKLYIQQEDWERAATHLQAAVEETPTDAEAWMLLAVARANLAQYAEAGQAFARAVDDPKHGPEATLLRRGWWVQSFNVGVDALQSDQFEVAARSFEAARAIDSDNIDAARNLGYAYYQLDRTQDAIAVYRQILALDPADKDVVLRLGYLYYNEESFADAIPLLADVAEGSDDAQLLGALATSYQAQEREDEALAVLEDAHARGVGGVDMLMELGRIYWIHKNFDKAATIYHDASRLEPDNADANHNYAMALLDLKKDDEARVVLERVVELNAEMGDAWYWLGAVYARKNQVEDSKAAFARAAELGVE